MSRSPSDFTKSANLLRSPWAMRAIEILIGLAIGVVALLPLFRGPRSGRSRIVIAVAIGLGVVFAAYYAPGTPRLPGKADGLPPQIAGADDRGYVSSGTCRSCHPAAYSSWHASYHRTMTQLASPQTVVAPFDDVTLESRGRTYQLKRRGDEFWIEMADPDIEGVMQLNGIDARTIPEPPRVERRIFMTTGSHHLQGYWIKSRYGNMLRQIPWFYLIRERRWAPREDVFLEPPDDVRHFSTWNDGCLQCHAVGGNPRMDVASGTGVPDSYVAEIGIACEACHGPAKKHVDRQRNLLTRYGFHGTDRPDESIVNPGRLDSRRASEVCGSCHGFAKVRKPVEFVTRGSPFRPGDEIRKHFEVVRYDPDMDERARDIFWADGACRTGGDEFNALSASACYERGDISCLSCHSMHHSDPNDQLADNRVGNEACLQCHIAYRDRISEHTHHAPQSQGSLCYNCHMPYTSYALLTAMRSHKIDSPSVEVDLRSGRPNACNTCHIDRTLGWTAEHLTEWYGAPEQPLDEDQRTIAESLLWLYRGDAVQRAIAGHSLGSKDAHQASGSDWIAPHLCRLLDDDYSAVRFVAERSLRSLSGFERISYDFIGPQQDRTAASRDIADNWQPGQETTSRHELSSILLDSDGRLQQDVIDRLMSTRDLRPVRVAE